MKKNKNTLTDSEKQVMELLWKEQKPMTSMEIAEQSTEYGWKSSYVFILIKSLLKKNMIEECGIIQSNTQYARQFRPCITKDEYAVKVTLALGLNKSSITKVAAALVMESVVNPEQTVKELENIIKKIRD